MKSNFLFLTLCTLSLSVVSCTNDIDVFDNASEVQTKEIEESPDVTFQMKANIAYNNMLNAFNNEISRSGEEQQEYPSYYGGAYINKDGALVVNVCDNNEDVAESLRGMAQSNDIQTASCEYSYNYLRTLQEKIREYKAANPNSELTKSFRITSLKEIENRIYVYLSNSSMFEIFKSEISDSPAICLFEADFSDKQAAYNINPGTGIYYQDAAGTHTGSMGYRAKRNGVTGIVTAGHVARTNGIELYSTFNGTSMYFGTSEYAVVGGSVDACFIKLYSNFEGTNVVGDGNLYTVAMTPAVGTVVNLRSYQGHKWGPIKGLNVDVDYLDGDSFSGLMDIDYGQSTVTGESGGVVYAIDSSTQLRYTVGIHEGYSPATGYAHTTKATEINRVLSLTQY